MPSGTYLTGEQITYIREHFANTPNKELAKTLGISISCINYQAHHMGLRKSREHSRKMHHLSGMACAAVGGGITLTPEMIRRRSESWKKRYQADRARLTFGLEQKTKIRVRLEPRAKVCQRKYLLNRGYIIDDRALVAYYTEDTKRATRLEAIGRGTKGKIHSYYDFKLWQQ